MFIPYKLNVGTKKDFIILIPDNSLEPDSTRRHSVKTFRQAGVSKRVAFQIFPTWRSRRIYIAPRFDTHVWQHLPAKIIHTC